MELQRDNGTVYADWFLPSRDELTQLYLNRGVVCGFTTKDYWSSSEGNLFDSWHLFFPNDIPDAEVKTTTLGVRAVRAF